MSQEDYGQGILLVGCTFQKAWSEAVIDPLREVKTLSEQIAPLKFEFLEGVYDPQSLILFAKEDFG